MCVSCHVYLAIGLGLTGVEKKIMHHFKAALQKNASFGIRIYKATLNGSKGSACSSKLKLMLFT